MKIIAIMGKAGCGKDTILHDIMARYPDRFNEIVSCTTRPPREGEQEGVSYFFITEDEFANKQLADEFLEWDSFNGWYYGTDKSKLAQTMVNIGVFTPRGIRKLMQRKDVDLKVYYLRVRDKTRLLRQLNRESNPDVNEIVRRFGADKKDFADLSDIPYVELINEDERDYGYALATILSKDIYV